MYVQKKKKEKKNQACVSYLFQEQSGSWRETSSTSARKEFSRWFVPPSHRHRALVESQPRRRCCCCGSSQVSPASSSLLQLLHLLRSRRASSTLAPRTDVMPGPGRRVDQSQSPLDPKTVWDQQDLSLLLQKMKNLKKKSKSDAFLISSL